MKKERHGAVIPATAEAVAVFLVAIIAVFAAGDNSEWWLEVKDLFERGKRDIAP